MGHPTSRTHSVSRFTSEPRRGLDESIGETRYGARLPTIFLDRNVVYHSTVECPDYPQPPEAWWAWPHYQKGI
jgi:hypothetical protein